MNSILSNVDFSGQIRIISYLRSIISTAQTTVRLFTFKDVQRLTNVDTLAMETIGDWPMAFDSGDGIWKKMKSMSLWDAVMGKG